MIGAALEAAGNKSLEQSDNDEGNPSPTRKEPRR
jgi:hypothetical protein